MIISSQDSARPTERLGVRAPFLRSFMAVILTLLLSLATSPAAVAGESQISGETSGVVTPTHHEGDYTIEERYADHLGNSVPLRRGSNDWGRIHIQNKHGWDDLKWHYTRQTLRYPREVHYQGTARVHYWDYNNGRNRWKVVHETGSGRMGIITSYRVR